MELSKIIYIFAHRVLIATVFFLLLLMVGRVSSSGFNSPPNSKQKPLEDENNELKQGNMEKTKFEEMMDRLPSNVKDSDVLRLESKKILAALLELLLHSEAKNSGIIYVGNGMLRRLSGVGSSNLLSGIQQLEDYELVTRIKGSVRKVQTEKGQASEYRINFKKLKEPIVEKTFDDLFSQFCEEVQSLEKPISTTITTTITTSTTTSNTNTTSTTNSTSIESTNTTSNETTFQEYKDKVEAMIEERCNGGKYEDILREEKTINQTLESWGSSLDTNTLGRLRRFTTFKLGRKKKLAIASM